MKKIVVCGSSKFMKEINEYVWEETKKGNMVLTFPFAKEDRPEIENYRMIMQKIHKAKIDLADEVFIFDKDGYKGQSTREEIHYAEKKGKKIVYLSTIIQEEKNKHRKIMGYLDDNKTIPIYEPDYENLKKHIENEKEIESKEYCGNPRDICPKCHRDSVEVMKKRDVNSSMITLGSSHRVIYNSLKPKLYACKFCGNVYVKSKDILGDKN